MPLDVISTLPLPSPTIPGLVAFGCNLFVDGMPSYFFDVGSSWWNGKTFADALPADISEYVLLTDAESRRDEEADVVAEE